MSESSPVYVVLSKTSASELFSYLEGQGGLSADVKDEVVLALIQALAAPLPQSK